MSGRSRQLLDLLAGRLRTAAAKVAESEPASRTADELVLVADRARDRHDWGGAAKHYALALDLRPSWPEIRVQLGNMLKEVGSLHEAEDAYRRALAENPENADTYLQLGHALKLQRRFDEAQDAYLAALKRQPGLRPARDELAALGLGGRVIEQHLAALTAGRGDRPAGTPDPALSVGALPSLIESAANAAPRGAISEIGLQHVAGVIAGCNADLPLTVVCRDGERTLAVAVVPSSAPGEPVPANSDGLPAELAFRLDLPNDLAGRILHVLIEPMSIELAGSPFLGVGPATESILTRLESLELAVERGGLTADQENRISSRLVNSVLAAAASRIESILDRQRTFFERELLALEASRGVPGAFGEWHEFEAPDYPLDVGLSARDLFPGLGWSAPQPGHDGRDERRLMRRGSLELFIGAAPGYLLQAHISADGDEYFLRRLRVTAGGKTVRFWIEADMDFVQGRARSMLSALVPGSARRGDGSVAIAIEVGDAPTHAHAGIAVADLRLIATPEISEPLARIDAHSPWLAQGWRRPRASDCGARMMRDRALVVLPSIVSPRAAFVRVEGRHIPPDISLRLNDVELTHRGSSRECVVASAPKDAWRAHSPNVLRLSVASQSPQEPGGSVADAPPPELISIELSPATTNCVSSR